MADEQAFALVPWFERRQGGLFDRDSNGMVQPPDELAWQGQRTFNVGERLDGAVNVAGNLVKIAKVESVIAACPGVEAVRVRMMRPEEGDRLKAFVIAREGATIQNLRTWCRSRLPAAARPAWFQFGGSLPKTETGKDCDW
jgi:acyl-coenzyme A synthetase/AMP-(fatty) acid ligase